MFILKFENFRCFHVFETVGTYASEAEALAAAEAHRAANSSHGKYHVFR